MGLILSARCGRCDFARAELRVGATMSQMSGESRSGVHLHACSTTMAVMGVERDDLIQSSVIMASFAYNAAMRTEKMPRNAMPKD